MRNWSGVLALATVLAFCATAQAQNSGPRWEMNLNPDWRFIRQDVPDASNPTFDDSLWQQVVLPHTWNNLDGQDGGNNYYRGPGWYRRHLNLSADAASLAAKRLYLCFDAASMVAQVYVNGKPAGEHKGAFAGFVFDVTDLLNLTGDNVIAVRVDNTHNVDVPTLAGDFTIFGGLYRPVHLLALDRLSISPIDDGGPGVYEQQISVTKDHASVRALTKLRNTNSTDKTATIQLDVLDAAGKIVSTVHRDQTVPANGTADAEQDFTITHPHLWNGRADPYLYTLHVTISDGKTVVDQLDQPLGVRFFRVDPDKGFFLNGVSDPLHGVNRHQDRLDKGWAISPDDQQQDFDLIMEMGCNAIRLSHYQHAQQFYDLCDHGGIVVWAEACLVNTVTDSSAFDQTAQQQLRELIKQSYNHPSICFWSLCNELSPGRGSTRPDQNPLLAHEVLVIGELNALAHALDPGRLTTAASNRPDPWFPFNQITDVMGYNYYDGWYGKTPAAFGPDLDKLHASRPDHSMGISEYGAGASVMEHEADPKQPRANNNPWHPEEWQTEVHEASWRAIHQRQWIWGSFIWCMFDFASDGRNEGDHAGRNDKGMVTYDRKTKKDAFYFYKANWSDDPFAYITDRRFTPRCVGKGPVKIYSNCDMVELKVNGQSLGSKKGDDIHIFLWDNVQLKQGENQLEAIGQKNGREYDDQCTITFDPTAATRESTVGE